MRTLITFIIIIIYCSLSIQTEGQVSSSQRDPKLDYKAASKNTTVNKSS